jgi:tetraacyldisaccharide 4'-kinase
MRVALLPFSFLYWIAIVLRNWFFDIGILKTTKIGLPVISVGNISAGGVGKTPFVEWIIESLAPRYQLAVVSRGYGRKSTGTFVVSNGKQILASAEESGDEPLQMARKYSKTIVVVDEQRVRGAQKAMMLGAQVVLLDDGFQHRYLHRDGNIVILTAQEIIHGDFLLPAGNRREPMNTLQRADIVVISRCRTLEEFYLASQKMSWLQRPVVGMQTKLKFLRSVQTNNEIPVDTLKNKSAFLFSGIGNPESFEQILATPDLKIVGHLRFPDHHWYSDNEMIRIQALAMNAKADAIISTEKDFSRLSGKIEHFKGLKIPLLEANIRQEFIAGEENLKQFFTKILY